MTPTNGKQAGPATAFGLGDVALLLDVDGTIVDLAATPRSVWVPPSLRETLAQLYERTGGALALVSGRKLADLDLMFAPLLLPCVGGHGAEMRLSPNGNSNQQRAAPLPGELKRRFASIAAAGPGILVEDKDYALALHYRLAPEQAETVNAAVAAICAELPRDTIEVLPGKAVLEIKSVGFNKGVAVRELMSYPPFAGRRPLFIGDDTTDETAFAVLPEFNGIGYSVGREVPGVSGRFGAPQEVRDWLGQIAQGDGTIAL
jgi:trehalose 6-phosphate phosphatase